MGDILFRVPGFKTLLKLTDNPQDPDQIEFAVWEWLQTSMNGKTLYDKLEMWDGGYIRVNRDDDEAGTILSIFFFGDNGVEGIYPFEIIPVSIDDYTFKPAH
jgi:hypothetical protein